MTEDDLVEICPDCKTAGCFSPRTRPGERRKNIVGDPDATYRCSNCGHTFDDPETRPRAENVPPPNRVVSEEDLDRVREKMGIGVDR